MKRNNKQQGFTIIELVVVILLLGILTATALPRFMDVTDEAHNAVVDGVIAGLNTSSALAHAQWIAKGEPTTIGGEFGSDLRLNAAGYPVSDGSTAIEDNDDCKFIFETLLQSGRPSIATAAAAGTLDAADITPPASSSDFVTAKAGTTCQYAYTGQFKDADTAVVPVLVYDPAKGSVERTTSL